ncbi:MAG: sn-glycerol-1-phosphate dehydrogenase [Candidatus Caldatribacteriaceae bacterium]
MQEDITSWAGKTFECTCGKTHRVRTQRILVGEDILSQVPKVLEEFNVQGKALVLFDENTYKAAGEEVEHVLQKRGFLVIPGLLSKEGNAPLLEPDERARSQIGEYLFYQPNFIVAVGGGVINDLAKFVASRVRLPYVAVATAPSMDGYVSPGAPMLVAGYKITYDATPPLVCFVDLKVVSSAPLPLLWAGFADLLGKITANADWVLRHVVWGEDFCEFLWEHTASFLKALDAQAEGIPKRNKEAVALLSHALLFSGLGMDMIGDSRPASGAEHLIAHYLEIMALQRGMHPSLHGLRVGAATAIVWHLYRMLFERGEEIFAHPPKDTESLDKVKVQFGPLFPFVEQEIQKKKHLPWPNLPLSLVREATEGKIFLLPNPLTTLQRAGIPPDFEALGLPLPLVKEACLFARFIRSRITVLDLLARFGLLEEFVEEALKKVAEATKAPQPGHQGS